MASSRGDLLTVVRVLLVAIGVTGTALTLYRLGSMPPPPPAGDGPGRTALFGGVMVIFTLGLAAVGVSLPALLGREDPLGFNRWQQLALKAAGTLIGVAIAVGLVSGLLPGIQWGILVSLALVSGAILVVVGTLAWRLLAVLLRIAGRPRGPDA